VFNQMLSEIFRDSVLTSTHRNEDWVLFEVLKGRSTLKEFINNRFGEVVIVRLGAQIALHGLVNIPRIELTKKCNNLRSQSFILAGVVKYSPTSLVLVLRVVVSFCNKPFDNLNMHII
jgi:hypothetical protein